jgi:hypothetical protein
MSGLLLERVLKRVLERSSVMRVGDAMAVLMPAPC